MRTLTRVVGGALVVLGLLALLWSGLSVLGAIVFLGTTELFSPNGVARFVLIRVALAVLAVVFGVALLGTTRRADVPPPR